MGRVSEKQLHGHRKVSRHRLTSHFVLYCFLYTSVPIGSHRFSCVFTVITAALCADLPTAVLCNDTDTPKSAAGIFNASSGRRHDCRAAARDAKSQEQASLFMERQELFMTKTIIIGGGLGGVSG